VSPFHDLGQRRGSPPPVESAMPSTGERLRENAGVQGISLPRFAWLLALGVLGLAGLLSLGVGGMALVSGYAFPAATANGAKGPGLAGK
jgi:hypothetical protein